MKSENLVALANLVKKVKILMPKERGGRPEPWGVTYAYANKDGSRKSCSNCMMWVPFNNSCTIHAPDVQVTANFICGYHVKGNPINIRQDELSIDYVTPEYSGLVHMSGGTSCDLCRWFEEDTEDRGLCMAVDTPEGTPAPVEAKGCCSRWEFLNSE